MHGKFRELNKRETMNNLDITARILCQLQSVLHSLDELSNTALYKHSLKNRTNNYYEFLEKWVHSFTDELDIKDQDNFVQIIKRLDELASEIKMVNNN